MRTYTHAILLMLVLVCCTQAADIFEPFYGSYVTTSSDLGYCRAMTNGQCTGMCCPLNYTIAKLQPGVSFILNFYFDPATLSRCGGSTLQYGTQQTYVKTTNGLYYATGSNVLSNVATSVYLDPQSVSIEFHIGSCSVMSNTKLPNTVSSSAVIPYTISVLVLMLSMTIAFQLL